MYTLHEDGTNREISGQFENWPRPRDGPTANPRTVTVSLD